MSQVIDFHVSGDLDKIAHLIGQHCSYNQITQLPDGTFLFSGIADHGSTREALAKIPGVALLPHRHAPKQLGALADLFKSLPIAKAPQAIHTTYEALTLFGAKGLHNPDA